MRSNLVVGLAGALALVASTAASAIPIQVSAGGVFREMENEQLLIEQGTPWSLDLRYESTNPDDRPANPFEGFYRGFLDFELAIGDTSYAVDELTAESAGVLVFNDRPTLGGLLRDRVSFQGAIADTTFGFTVSAVFLSQTSGAGPFQSDALIDPALMESAFTQVLSPDWQIVELVFYDLPLGQTTSTRFVTASVDRFSASVVSVPEPATIALLAPALLLLARARRRAVRS